MNKIIIGISVAIWIVDIGLQINGRYHLQIIGEFL